MNETGPLLVVLAGPNGSGKTTTAPTLLKGKLGVGEFVNADLIADPETWTQIEQEYAHGH